MPVSPKVFQMYQLSLPGLTSDGPGLNSNQINFPIESTLTSFMGSFFLKSLTPSRGCVVYLPELIFTEINFLPLRYLFRISVVRATSLTSGIVILPSYLLLSYIFNIYL